MLKPLSGRVPGFLPDGHLEGGSKVGLDIYSEQGEMKEADRQKVEAELLNAKKLEAIGVLAGGIAHDFNNLLFVIMGNINMAQIKIEDDHEAQRHLLEAEKACLRAKDLTQKFITFSSGGGPVKRLVSMRDLVSSVVGLMLSGSTTGSEIDTPSDLWLVEVDENQMRQVFTACWKMPANQCLEAARFRYAPKMSKSPKAVTKGLLRMQGVT